MATRTALDTALLRRVGPWLTLVGLDATIGSDDLTDAVSRALGWLALAPADPFVVVDADVVRAPDAFVLVELATLAACEVIATRYSEVDTRASDMSLSLDQLMARVTAKISTLRRQYAVTLAAAPGALPTGTITAGIIARRADDGFLL